MVLTEAEKIEKEIIRRELVNRNREDKKFRLRSWLVYKIKDKRGKIVDYNPNPYQLMLQDNQHNRNIILKARQLWFSTDINIQALDYALNNDNVNVGIIAQDKDKAEDIFRDKVKVAFDNLPKNIKDKYKVNTDSTRELSFSNGSRISVGTSFRSWTLQFLHISEFWKICAKFPEKAREIVTWAIEALSIDWMLFIESTAEGNEWYFYEFFKQARDDMEAWKDLSKLDLKPFFFAWRDNAAYTLADDAKVLITLEDLNYFKSIEERCKMKLTLGQKKWYVKKKALLKDDMGREYPSFWEEAFDLAVEWAYYERELALMRRQKRIWEFPWNPAKPVYAVRDLWWFGWWDEMATIMYQKNWEWIDIIDYVEETGYSIDEYQTNFITPKWYNILEDWFPHDWRRKESNGKSIAQNARELGIPVRQLKIWWIRDWINEAKRMFYRVRINEATCSKLIKSLSNYKRERDKKKWCFMDKPYHNRASHWADAFRYLFMTFKEDKSKPANKRTRKIWSAEQWDFIEVSY